MKIRDSSVHVDKFKITMRFLRIGLKLSHCYHAWVHQNSEKNINDSREIKVVPAEENKNSFPRVFLETEATLRVKSSHYISSSFILKKNSLEKQWSISCHNVINGCMKFPFSRGSRDSISFEFKVSLDFWWEKKINFPNDYERVFFSKF